MKPYYGIFGISGRSGKSGKHSCGGGKSCCGQKDCYEILHDLEVVGETDPCCDNLLYEIETKRAWCPVFYFAVFENYKSMIELSMEQATLNKNCRSCADVPTSLYKALESEFCYDDFFNTITKQEGRPCKCLPMNNVDLCKLKSGKLYRYYYSQSNTYEKAKQRLKQAKRKGYSKAFIVAFDGDKKITISEALRRSK